MQTCYIYSHIFWAEILQEKSMYGVVLVSLEGKTIFPTYK